MSQKTPSMFAVRWSNLLIAMANSLVWRVPALCGPFLAKNHKTTKDYLL
jgi:hypothetical protein